MQIYKVGGAVRDQVLGIKSCDNDFVVVNSSVDEMLSLGFIAVGRDFPVFLHPKTHEEYALARTERKVSPGHTGFKFYADNKVTLLEDLMRRDITINAIAEDNMGNIIDPFNGIADIHNKVIRHVSNAFTEDPLRVFRAARFSAKFNFIIVEQTIELMRTVVKNNELEYLSDERIWHEVDKAVMTNYSHNFFSYLKLVGVFNHIFQEFNYLFLNNRLINEVRLHLDSFKDNNLTLAMRYAIIYFFLRFSPDIEQKVQSSKLKRDYREFIICLYRFCYFNEQYTAQNILALITSLDPIRRENRFNSLIQVIKTIDYNTQLLNIIIKGTNLIKQINYKEELKNLDQSQIIEHIHSLKIVAIESVLCCL